MTARRRAGMQVARIVAAAVALATPVVASNATAGAAGMEATLTVR